MDRREEKIAELESKIFDLKQTILDLKAANAKMQAKIDEFRNKEQTISNAIMASMEHANQLEASRKKLLTLDLQRSRLMYLRMEQTIHELYLKYPELKKDTKLKDMSEKFKSMVYSDLNDVKSNPIQQINKPTQVSSDDPIKKLLRNIIDCFETKKPETEIRIKTPTDATADLMQVPSSSGFDFNEALHPTMDLDEIMKAFNFGKKEGNN
jgi:cell division septum initiation protein DivIVA